MSLIFHSLNALLWYDMQCHDMMWFDMIWYDMIWYDMIWYDMMWYDMIWYDMIWYDMLFKSTNYHLIKWTMNITGISERRSAC